MPFLPPSKYFPPAESADEDGLVCAGGQLSTDELLDAYRHGLFPWPVVGERTPMLWWSPDPRAIFKLDGLYISKRLRRTCRSGRYQVTADVDFPGVLEGCATVLDRREEVWLTPTMRRAYIRLHQQGHAHSVEVWQDDKLVGGVYGVAIGGLFSAESMFYRATDASKVALVHLFDHLNARGYQLLDIQQLTDHTASLGATELPRDEYLRQLAKVVDLPVTFGTLQNTDG